MAWSSQQPAQEVPTEVDKGGGKSVKVEILCMVACKWWPKASWKNEASPPVSSSRGSEMIGSLLYWTQPQTPPPTHIQPTGSLRPWPPQVLFARPPALLPASQVPDHPNCSTRSSLASRLDALPLLPKSTYYGTRHASPGQQHAAERAVVRGGQCLGTTEVPHGTHFCGLRGEL